MADLAQTITNTLNILGPSVPSRWNLFNWGENWGVTGDLQTFYEKGLFESITLTDSIGKAPSITPISETIGFSIGLDIFRSIGIWDYNFTRPTIDGSEAVYDESSKIADPSTTWSKQSDPSTDWS